MAFAYTETDRTVFGNKKVVYGTFTNGVADTGGAIATGLRSIEFPAGTANSGVEAVQCAVSGGTLTVTTNAGVDGYWMAIGY